MRSEPLRGDMGIDMFTSVLLAVTDKVAELAEAARIKGAAGAPAGEKGGERPLEAAGQFEGCQGGGERGKKKQPKWCIS